MNIKLKTPKEVAEEYGFSVSHIRKLISQGTIPAEKLGRCYAINPDNIKDLRRRRKLTKDDDNGTIE